LSDFVAADRRRAESEAFDGWRLRLARGQRNSAFRQQRALANRRAFQNVGTPLPPLSPALHARLVRVAHECCAPSAAGALAGIGLLLECSTERRTQVIGVTYANRDRPGQERLLGCLAEVIPVVIDMNSCSTFRDVVYVAGRALHEFRRAGVTMSALFPESGGQGPWRGEATCDVLLNYMAAGDARFDHPGAGSFDARFHGYSIAQPKPVRTLWDFALVDFTIAGARGGGLTGVVNYNAAAVERSVAQEFGRTFTRILQIIALRPDQRTRSLLDSLARCLPRLSSS
jgi:hypothetical protein